MDVSFVLSDKHKKDAEIKRREEEEQEQEQEQEDNEEEEEESVDGSQRQMNQCDTTSEGTFALGP